MCPAKAGPSWRGPSREGQFDPPLLGEAAGAFLESAPEMAGWAGGHCCRLVLTPPTLLVWRCSSGVPYSRTPARLSHRPVSAAGRGRAACPLRSLPPEPDGVREHPSGRDRAGKGRGSGLRPPRNTVVPWGGLGWGQWFGRSGALSPQQTSSLY